MSSPTYLDGETPAQRLERLAAKEHIELTTGDGCTFRIVSEGPLDEAFAMVRQSIVNEASRRRSLVFPLPTDHQRTPV